MLLIWRAYLLDEASNLSVVCDVKFVEGFPRETEGILLHYLQHVGVTYDRFALQHPLTLVVDPRGDDWKLQNFSSLGKAKKNCV